MNEQLATPTPPLSPEAGARPEIFDQTTQLIDHILVRHRFPTQTDEEGVKHQFAYLDGYASSVGKTISPDGTVQYYYDAMRDEDGAAHNHVSWKFDPQTGKAERTIQDRDIPAKTEDLSDLENGHQKVFDALLGEYLWKLRSGHIRKRFIGRAALSHYFPLLSTRKFTRRASPEA